jgi:23S rRNA-/tRNA-specific pseudouridylate synthase
MLEIIYQDEWLVAVNKPSGWLVHRSWLDRDEKVVVMQPCATRLVSTCLPPIALTARHRVSC